MERSVRNIKEMLRENVTRFLEHADGREVIVKVTARLIKKRQFDPFSNDAILHLKSEEQKRIEKDIEIEHSQRNLAKNTDKTLSHVNKSATVSSRNGSSGIDWYGKGKDRYHYSKE
uniref:ENTH domain-containing protein n=1 Tax=Elaeophora elaphi TaxID=1147741 RepID=A0A158Q7U6_9BILA